MSEVPDAQMHFLIMEISDPQSIRSLVEKFTDASNPARQQRCYLTLVA